MPHLDGPAYNPKVIVLSLNSYVIIDFQKEYMSGEQQVKAQESLLLEPNSIHIFEEAAYTEYLHGIRNLSIDSFYIRFK